MTSPLEAAREAFARLDFDPAVRAQALAALEPWLTDDTFAEYRPQLEKLIADGRAEDLFDAFWQTIPFGTGGRRGAVGIGSNRFNSWTLLTSVQGHAEILKETYPGEEVSVVIAYDVRVYNDLRGVYDPDLPNPLMGKSSADFAAEAAGVYAANGIRVAMLDPRGGDYMSTPELSLAIRRHRAHGGLNVSASHNPPDDNGGKFYNRHGGQDVPPDDEVLARRVEGIREVHRIDFDQAVADGLVRLLGPEENEHYLAVNERLSVSDARGGRIVYTPLHGTGSNTVGRLLRRMGFDVRAVPAQEPFDGSFPAVKFRAPNPENPSCYDLAEGIADECEADIILSTDPDADRIGLEVRRPDGGWLFVRGDEILFLVTRYLLDRRREAGRLPEDAFVLKTLVTSNLITTIARSYGCKVVPDLLVGFKYMAELLAGLEADGQFGELKARAESLVLGVEESHGVLCTPAVRDKDAGGGALALAELNATLVAEGRTMYQEIEDLYRRFGYMANTLIVTVMTGAAGLDRIRGIQASLRADPPTEVAGRRVVSFEDMADEEGRMGPIKSGTDAAARNVLVFKLEGDAQLVIRPSGTEPKNKIYVEVPGTTPSTDLTPEELAAERDRCEREADELGRAFERLTLARVGIDLAPCASRLSGLLGLEQKVHFGSTFVPALARAAADPAVDLEAFVDEQLADYGSDPRDLVVGGVAAWLDEGALDGAAEARVRDVFGLGSGQAV